MAQPKFDQNDWKFLKQCIEASTFSGNSIRFAVGVLDKVEYMIDGTKEE